MLIIKPKYNKKRTKSTIKTFEVTSRHGAHEKEQEASAPKRKRIDKLINGKGIYTNNGCIEH